MNEKLKTIEYSEWITEAFKRYPDKNITFVCPVCGYRQSVNDLKEAGAGEGSWGFSCIGRVMPNCRNAFGGNKNGWKGPCNYAGGGLIRLNPVRVRFEDGTVHDYFDFADDPLYPKEGES